MVKKSINRIHSRIVRHTKMALVPHDGNQYRPHLTRRYGIVGVLLLVIALQAGYNIYNAGSVLGLKTNLTNETLLLDTNEQRLSQHLPALKINSELSRAAAMKANDMLSQQYWAHIAPDGTTPWMWFGRVGYGYSYAGENLAKNFTTPNAVTSAWMASPEHRANILDPHYVDVGFAVTEGNLNGQATVLVVALYGSAVGSNVGFGAQNSILNASSSHSINLATRLGVAIQSLTPAALGSVIILVLLAGVAFIAHLYRNKLPPELKKGFYKHHGIIKVAGVFFVVLTIVTIYGGGQI